MKKETLEKIRNFLEYLFVLFMSILIMLITFGSLHVHAGFVDSIPDNYNAVNMSAYNSFCLNDGESSSKYPDYPYNISENITMYVPDDVFVGCYQKNDYSNFNVSNGPVSFILLSKQPFTSYYYVSGGSNDGKVCASVANYNSTYGFYAGSTIFKHSYGVDGQSQFDYSHVDDSKFSHTIFRYSTDDELYQYFSDVAAGKIDNTNKPDIDNPDFEDTAYAFTGFTANNKMTATWTGTTERSYLQNQEVEEYVRVNYYFADKEAQDTIKQADAYPDEFATADKTLTIDVSGLKSDDENWFLRYIRITPCYRQAGLGVWGDFYHGSDVYVYFDLKGNIESIVQNSVPTDGEVIGNNISLIGFRYDTSFHAEFVDVWSNAVNCSAFDLGGSQYLSLGVKAIYYNGQSKDIDFVSLDRKNLVWDKTFDSFKTLNGSSIKQLFFTPYIKTGVNNPWNKGNSIVIDFDVNGKATSSFDTGDDGTVHLSDFKLTGVVWNKPMLAYGTITWTGTTANSDMSIVPDSDTLVVCSYPVYDSSLNESYETYDTVTIGKGSIRVYIDSLIDKYTNAGRTWNGEMWLTPCYKKGGVLYMGEPVIVNCIKGTVSDIEVDESTGTGNQIDKTDENKSYADSVLSSGNNFFSIVKGLIASMQQLPEFIAIIFSFLPGWVNALIAGSIFVIFVCRILGR